MKKIIAAALLWLCSPAFSATVYACACSTGAHANCVAGSNTAPYDTPAKSINTIAQWKTSWQALAAGDNLSTCQGGAFSAVATGNMANTNATRSSPVVIDSYDDTARWSGGAGIKPIFRGSGAGGILSFNKASNFHTEGYTVRDIQIIGDGSLTDWGIISAGGADVDYMLIDNVTISGTKVGVQSNVGTNSAITPSGLSDGISQNWTIRNSSFSTMNDLGILISSSNTLIDNNTFQFIGTQVGDHSIYLGGGTIIYTPQTISSITGNGTTATLTTATPHLIPTGAHFTIGVTGSTSSGSGTFNVTGGIGGVIGTATGPSTITYAATGTPSASVVGAYTNLVVVPAVGAVVRNNTSSDASLTGPGGCVEAHIIVHGDWNNILIENNLIQESIVPTNTACNGIELDSGGYGTPESYEQINKVVIRNNTVLNMAQGILLDLSRQSLIENNYVYSTFTGFDAFGIRMRAKNFVPGTVGTSTLSATQQSPDNVTIRYNTVYLTAIGASGWGIALNGNVGDPLTGLHHNLYGNVVVLGSSATTATMCYATQNMTLAMFDVKDYNACYYLSAAVPKWENTSSLATIQAVGNPNKSDLNSIMASTTSVTADQPFFTAPTTSPTISTSSALKNAGHPTLGPRTGWGGSVRNQGVRDIGSFEFGATLGVVPNSPTNP